MVSAAGELQRGLFGVHAGCGGFLHKSHFMNRHFYPIVERTGLDIRFHDLRHTCAIRMIRDERLTLRDVQAILGHAHLSTTQIYAHVTTERLRKVYEKAHPRA